MNLKINTKPKTSDHGIMCSANKKSQTRNNNSNINKVFYILFFPLFLVKLFVAE
jgi:hypothetical protein